MTTATAMDGRTIRRERNRSRVVEAMLELIDEGELQPTVEQVVERSGISARSVFRYFDGLDDLRRAVMHRNFQRIEPMLAVDHIGRGSFDDRVARFVETRLRACEAMAGPARISRLNEPFEPTVAEERSRFRGLLAEQVRVHFAAELAGRSRADAGDLEAVVDVLVSFDSWDQLTTAHGRSRPQIRRAWNRALTAILTS
jgi:TetR/AcrR family transcriptional regulator of autoinduction and epiphytic fitness